MGIKQAKTYELLIQSLSVICSLQSRHYGYFIKSKCTLTREAVTYSTSIKPEAGIIIGLGNKGHNRTHLSSQAGVDFLNKLPELFKVYETFTAF